MSNILRQILSSTRSGQPVPGEFAEQVLSQCRNVPCYAKLASQEGVQLCVQTLQVAGRKGKYVCFKDANVPITANKLYASAKKSKPCKHCKLHNCARASVIAAFRASIHSQISDYRREIHQEVDALLTEGSSMSLARARQLMRCALTGQVLALGQTHVDHKFPFKNLLSDFCILHSIDLCYTRLKGRGNCKQIADESIANAWQSYHKEHAVLQIVTAKANLQKGAKA